MTCAEQLSHPSVAGCTEAEIAAITGHKLGDVRSILDAYLDRGPALAESAIRKLEKRTKSQTASQTVPECSVGEEREK